MHAQLTEFSGWRRYISTGCLNLKQRKNKIEQINEFQDEKSILMSF